MSQLFVYAAQSGQNLESTQQSGGFLSSLLSLLVVFVGFVVVLVLVRQISVAKSRSANPSEESAEGSQSAPAAPKGAPIQGSMGEVKLHSVPDKTAAMLMAIVADKMDAPLNEIRFISIREV